MASKQFDAIVIGSGPGGYVCAIRLAQLGIKTAIVEREFIGGVCLNVGCIPSKALIYAGKQYYASLHTNKEMGITAPKVDLDAKKMQAWKGDIVKKLTGGVGQLLKANGVEVVRGVATFVDGKTIDVKGSGAVERLTAKNIVIATGSSIAALPTLPFDGKTVINSTDALALEEIPKKMIVVGGGYIGMELGMAYAKLGSQVTVVEAGERILAAVDREITQVVEKKAAKLGIAIHVGVKLGKVETTKSGAKLEVELADKSKKTFDADKILVSVGRKPNSGGLGLEKLGVKIDARGNIETDKQGKTSAAGLWAIGDVSGAPQLAHRASMDGLIVAAAIAGEKSFKDYKTVPWAIFCDPEVSGVGLSEEEAKQKGFNVIVGKFPFVANARALSTNEGDGMAKIVIDAKTEAILGAQIVGPDASTLIAEITLAIEMGATAEDIERTIHTHPTLPETLPEAVEAAFYKSIHIFKPKPKVATARQPEKAV